MLTEGKGGLKMRHLQETRVLKKIHLLKIRVEGCACVRVCMCVQKEDCLQAHTQTLSLTHTTSVRSEKTFARQQV